MGVVLKLEAVKRLWVRRTLDLFKRGGDSSDVKPCPDCGSHACVCEEE